MPLTGTQSNTPSWPQASLKSFELLAPQAEPRVEFYCRLPGCQAIATHSEESPAAKKCYPQRCVCLVGHGSGFTGTSKGRHCFLHFLWHYVYWQTSVFSGVTNQTTAGSQAVCQCAGRISHFSWYIAAELDFFFFVEALKHVEFATWEKVVLVCIYL